MKIGIAVICRYSSSRLPGKILKEIKGRTVLGHIVDRIRRCSQNYSLVIATSSEPSDDAISEYCKRSGLNCFRGSLEDVAGRLLVCAVHHSWDFVVRINGDNLFTDWGSLNDMLAVTETNIFDFITNVPGRTFPYGMSIEILRVSFFKTIIEKYNKVEYKEHVTSWLYDNPDVGKRYIYINNKCPEAKGLNLALDTEEDFSRFTDIITRMDKAPFSYDLMAINRLATTPKQHNPWKGNYGPLLIAEIGGNHEGDFTVAKDMAQKAIATGVDYVKFQLYRGDTIVSSVESPDRHIHFQKFELSREQHVELAQLCHDEGVGYLASVWDLDMLDWVDPFLKCYKIGSGDLTAWPIIEEFVRRKKPIILSTGLATMDEVMQTVNWVQSLDERYKDPNWLCLLQCTSMYPIAESDANLRVMDSLRQATGLSVGYSDHTENGLALRTAAAMGADVLEFHFTDKRAGKVFRDHKVSLEPDEVLALQKDLTSIKNLIGSQFKMPQDIELSEGHVVSFRRGTYFKRNISSGEVIQEKDLVYLRPNHGLDVRDYYLVIGKTTANYMPALRKIELSNVI